ncbi:hypothetical protein HDV00_006434 [Rhizophlyctis rosea]|nr:hypothetical protein HDV00_006434 [Rhizophlyctis rosea]
MATHKAPSVISITAATLPARLDIGDIQSWALLGKFFKGSAWDGETLKLRFDNGKAAENFQRLLKREEIQMELQKLESLPTRISDPYPSGATSEVFVLRQKGLTASNVCKFFPKRWQPLRFTSCLRGFIAHFATVETARAALNELRSTSTLLAHHWPLVALDDDIITPYHGLVNNGIVSSTLYIPYAGSPISVVIALVRTLPGCRHVHLYFTKTRLVPALFVAFTSPAHAARALTWLRIGMTARYADSEYLERLSGVHPRHHAPTCCISFRIQYVAHPASAPHLLAVIEPYEGVVKTCYDDATKSLKVRFGTVSQATKAVEDVRYLNVDVKFEPPSIIESFAQPSPWRALGSKGKEVAPISQAVRRSPTIAAPKLKAIEPPAPVDTRPSQPSPPFHNVDVQRPSETPEPAISTQTSNSPFTFEQQTSSPETLVDEPMSPNILRDQLIQPHIPSPINPKPVMRLRNLSLTTETSHRLCNALSSSFMGLRCATVPQSSEGSDGSTGMNIYLLFDSRKHCTDVINTLMIWGEVIVASFAGGNGGEQESFRCSWFEECDEGDVPKAVRDTFAGCGADETYRPMGTEVSAVEVMNALAKSLERQSSASSPNEEEEDRKQEGDRNVADGGGVGLGQSGEVASTATAEVATEDVVQSLAETRMMSGIVTLDAFAKERRVIVVRKDEEGMIGDAVKMVFEWKGRRNGCYETSVPEKMVRDVMDLVFDLEEGKRGGDK